MVTPQEVTPSPEVLLESFESASGAESSHGAVSSTIETNATGDADRSASELAWRRATATTAVLSKVTAGAQQGPTAAPSSDSTSSYGICLPSTATSSPRRSPPLLRVAAGASWSVTADADQTAPCHRQLSTGSSSSADAEGARSRQVSAASSSSVATSVAEELRGRDLDGVGLNRCPSHPAPLAHITCAGPVITDRCALLWHEHKLCVFVLAKWVDGNCASSSISKPALFPRVLVQCVVDGE